MLMNFKHVDPAVFVNLICFRVASIKYSAPIQFQINIHCNKYSGMQRTILQTGQEPAASRNSQSASEGMTKMQVRGSRWARVKVKVRPNKVTINITWVSREICYYWDSGCRVWWWHFYIWPKISPMWGKNVKFRVPKWFLKMCLSSPISSLDSKDVIYFYARYLKMPKIRFKEVTSTI